VARNIAGQSIAGSAAIHAPNFTQAAANKSNPDQEIFSRTTKSQDGQWDL
jgi:hypothetical protein